MAERLAGVKTTVGTTPEGRNEIVNAELPKLKVHGHNEIARQIADIQKALAEQAQSLGTDKPVPTDGEVVQVRKMVMELRQTIKDAKDQKSLKLSEQDIDEVLEDLRRWTRPLFVTDISNSGDKER